MTIFFNKTQRLIAEAKTQLAELEAEWDRLDSMGTQTEKQQEIAGQMLKISSEIQGFEKLLTILRKGKK